MGTERPQPGRVETGGGAFIGGSVRTGGGDFVGRDSTMPVVQGSVGNLSAGAVQGGTVNQEAPSLAGFQDLLQDFAAQVRSADLSDALRDALIVDAEVVLEESQAAEPDKDLIVHKVGAISQLVEHMSVTTASLTELATLAHRLVEWASSLFG